MSAESLWQWIKESVCEWGRAHKQNPAPIANCYFTSSAPPFSLSSLSSPSCLFLSILFFSPQTHDNNTAHTIHPFHLSWWLKITFVWRFLLNPCSFLVRWDLFSLAQMVGGWTSHHKSTVIQGSSFLLPLGSGCSLLPAIFPSKPNSSWKKRPSRQSLSVVFWPPWKSQLCWADEQMVPWHKLFTRRNG